MTNVNDPADATAIKIAHNYISTLTKKMKAELTSELDWIKEFEEAIRGMYPIEYFYLLFKSHVLILFRITRAWS